MKTFILTVLMMLCLDAEAWAQASGNSASQSLILEVRPVAKISVSGGVIPLVIRDAAAGNNLLSVTDENSTYSLVTNLDNMKIVASISGGTPAGTTLFIKLSSAHATSAGFVDISTAMTPIDVVTGIKRGRDKDQSITYTFAATADVIEIAAQTRTVTLTITN